MDKTEFFLRKIVNNFTINKYNKIINQMSSYKQLINNMTLDEIKERFTSLKEITKKDMPFIFTMIDKVLYEKLNIKAYKEQYMCALALIDGYITEMKTGEGKTISGAIASIILSKKGKVHIATVNDYLAKRDCLKLRPVYECFGLTCDYNEREKENKKKLYENDIVYSSSSELIFDYLRDELIIDRNKKIITDKLDSVIIDEVDFVLLDNANSRFSINTGFSYSVNKKEYILAKEIVNFLEGKKVKKITKNKDYLNLIELENKVDYVYSEYRHQVYFTFKGIEYLNKLLNEEGILHNNYKFYKILVDTLKAKHFYKKGRDYIVSNNRIILINRNNGRLMPNSTLEDTLHTAIEVKENVYVKEKSLISNSMSYQMFFIKYKHMVGMSGTVFSASNEFNSIFNKDTLIIPTHKPNKRIDHPDLFFKTKEDKYSYLLDYLKYKRNINQPILIVTESEKESEEIFNMLKQNNLKCNLLNAQNTKEEENIVKNAGIHGNITISTNIAGRGTDIIIDEIAQKNGGLLVICLNHYLSKRIDNQVRGRTGRQGQLGECVFLVSLEDEMFKYVDEKMTSKIIKLFNQTKENKNKHLEKILYKIQNEYQTNLESYRHNLFKVEYIMEKQKEVIFNDMQNLIQKDILEILKEYQFKSSYIRNNLNSLIDNRQLEKKIVNQINLLGKDVANKLFKGLVNYLTIYHWIIYKKELYDFIEGYLNFYSIREERNLWNFIKLCYENLKYFNDWLIHDLFIFFINAKKKIINLYN